MQKYVQEKATTTSVTSTFQTGLLLLAWTFLVASWVAIVAAIRSFIIADREYGLLSAGTFLDVGFGYYGLFSLALAAVAVLLAIQGSVASKRK